MDAWIGGIVFVGGLFVGMLLMLETGRRLRLRRLVRDTEAGSAGLGAVEGAVFALLGLLIAFTFSGAASRFDERRHLIVEEANDIGTAYLRLDLLPAEPRAALQDKLRQYLDARLAAYRAIPVMEKTRAELARSATLQGEIWTQAVAASQQASTSQTAMLLLPALNAMFDITTTRTAATRMHPPLVIFGLLGALALACALLAGFGMGGDSRSWVHIVGFAAILAIAVYVIIDLEYPRIGLIRVDSFDQLLVDVRNTMR